MKTKILTTALIAMICFTACEKEEDVKPETPVPTAPANESASTNPVPADADGVLVAVSSKSGSGLFSITIGTGVALFYKDSALVSAGKVSVNSTNLTRSEGNSYYSTPGPVNPSGIDFSTDRDWTVEGGNGIPAFSYNNKNRSMPTAGENTSPDNVSRSADYTVSVTTLSGADSVLFVLGNLTYTAAGNTISHTFTADEIAANLKNGQAAAMVVPYNLNARQFSGKRFYFINEAVSTKVVTVQE